MRTFCFFILLLISTQVFGKTLPEFTLSVVLKAAQVKLSAVPPKDHHFNIKAPMVLKDVGGTQSVKPALAEPGQIEFILPATVHNFIITLYLCDDAKTYCKKHKLQASWNGKKLIY